MTITCEDEVFKLHQVVVCMQVAHIKAIIDSDSNQDRNWTCNREYSVGYDTRSVSGNQLNIPNVVSVQQGGHSSLDLVPLYPSVIRAREFL